LRARDKMKRSAVRGRGRGKPTRGGRGGMRTENREREKKVESEPQVIESIPSLQVGFEKMSPEELVNTKITLLNTMSSALIKEPRFSDAESVANRIRTLVMKIHFYDPEFIFKLVAYCRLDLNIRSTSNFLIATACNLVLCHPHLKKYFNAVVKLPTDWIDVAAVFMALPDKYLANSSNALPTALRKAMVAKFSSFDVYQLGN
jgi:telomerase protein component 1